MASGALRGGGRAAETRWRRHIVGQLKLRDRRQHDKFQDLIRFCTHSAAGENQSDPRQLAYQVVQLQQQIKIKDSVLDEQHARQQQEEPLLQVRLIPGWRCRGGWRQSEGRWSSRGGEVEGHRGNEVGVVPEDPHLHQSAVPEERGQSVSSLQEDQLFPVGVCLSARLPVRALHVLEAHEQGINAVRFNSSSELLATGGTDRAVKLWDVRAGSLTHRATLDGSTEGVTCIEFDPKGPRVLAASYDKSALLWRLDDPVPKVTLTGHSRRVTAARFGLNLQVVTGSADRTVRLAVRCIQELPAHGKVTSLDISPDHRHLLSCCRDDCLQLIDLRGGATSASASEPTGLKCGSDSTKAVISPDGCFLAAGSADGAVYIWNFVHQRCLLVSVGRIRRQRGPKSSCRPLEDV
ncbi:hypothetical protein F7725_021301 [Dissostichus mawsoni]|uniref:Uncharacterized protein n=1 Tax=Dissostichus mawsoni TaxID=36200 RepID=A0A7J5YGK7_DISMA|nr:hypothetical protein F7725_021301 [Dissostichus mawsoni]